MSALPVIVSARLELPGVRHAFFTRQGGVSRGIYDSLNLGRGSEDHPAHVFENRRRAAAHFGLGPAALSICFQLHSSRVLTTQAPFGDRRPEGDGVATGRSGVICGALAADCAPILLADADARVVAAAHAGWKGALSGICEAAVEQMVGLGARRERIVAVIGPCIAPQSYEVGLEFLQRFEAADPQNAAFFRPGETSDKRYFDLPGFALHRLRRAGIAGCEWVGLDTCAEPDRFYSNRRAFKQKEPDFGRLLSAIALVD